MIFRFILLLVLVQFGVAGCSSNKGKSSSAPKTIENKLSVEDRNELITQAEIYDTEKKYLDIQISAESPTLESSQKMLASFSKIESSTKIMKALCEDHKSEQTCIQLKSRIESQEKYAKGKTILAQKADLIREDYNKSSADYQSAILFIQDETKSLAKEAITVADPHPGSIVYSQSVEYLNKKLSSVNKIVDAYEQIEKLCERFGKEESYSKACANSGLADAKQKYLDLKTTIEERLTKLDQEKQIAAFEKQKSEYFKTHTEASVVFAGSNASYIEFNNGEVDVSPLIGSYRIESIVKFVKKSIVDYDSRDVKFDPGSASLNKQMIMLKDFIKKCQDPTYLGKVNLLALRKIMDGSNIDLVYSVFIHTDYYAPQFKSRLANFRLEWYRSFDLSNSTSLATRFKEDYLAIKSAGLVTPQIFEIYSKFEQEVAAYSEKYKFGLGLPFP